MISPKVVAPVKTGVQDIYKPFGSRSERDWIPAPAPDSDPGSAGKGHFLTFYDPIIFDFQIAREHENGEIDLTNADVPRIIVKASERVQVDQVEKEDRKKKK